MGVVSLALSLIRVSVLFAESYTVVSVERASDNELLKICKEQERAAISSSKLRGACLSARTDSAAPLLFKAMLKSVQTLFSDFAELFSSPTRILILILFVLSGLGAPIAGLALQTFLAGVRATSGGKEHESDSDSDNDRRPLTLVVSPGLDDWNQIDSQNSFLTRRKSARSIDELKFLKHHEEL